MQLNYDQTKIEGAIADAVQQMKVSPHVFAGGRPQSTNDRMDQFVVVRLVGGVTDLNAYGEGICSVDLYAKDLSGGYKNTKKLSAMYKKLVSGLPDAIEPVLIGDVRIIADARDGYGFHARMINMEITIKP